MTFFSLKINSSSSSMGFSFPIRLNRSTLVIQLPQGQGSFRILVLSPVRYRIRGIASASIVVITRCHQVLPLSVRKDSSFFIYNFGINIVFPNMHPLKCLTGNSTSKTDFPGSVMGIKPGSKQIFDFSAYGIRTKIRTDQGPLYTAPFLQPKKGKKGYRHSHKGLRLLPSKNFKKLPIGFSHSSFQRQGRPASKALPEKK